MPPMNRRCSWDELAAGAAAAVNSRRMGRTAWACGSWSGWTKTVHAFPIFLPTAYHRWGMGWVIRRGSWVPSLNTSCATYTQREVYLF